MVDWDDEYAGKPVPRIIVGLGYGDEGKGMATCHEVERSIEDGLRPVVVRYNGGSQAAHNVRIIENGKTRHHTSQQLGSGCLHRADTILTSGMLVDPVSIIHEADEVAREIQDPYVLTRLTIDEDAPMVLPLHAIVNRALEERRGTSRHGSTGRGIGVARACETAWKSGDGVPLTISLLPHHDALANAIAYWNGWCERHFDLRLGLDAVWADEQATMLERFYDSLVGYGVTFDDTKQQVRGLLDDGYHGITFEGSQGVLLDERYGWFPHVTYGDMTQKNAKELADGVPTLTLGITRTYSTRHGYGPFPPERTFDADEPDNGTGQWQGAFRTGLLDLPTLGRVSDVIRPDAIAMSFADSNVRSVITGWNVQDERMGQQVVPSDPIIMHVNGTQEIKRQIEETTGIPVTVVGNGPATNEWHDARSIVSG